MYIPSNQTITLKSGTHACVLYAQQYEETIFQAFAPIAYWKYDIETLRNQHYTSSLFNKVFGYLENNSYLCSQFQRITDNTNVAEYQYRV